MDGDFSDTLRRKWRDFSGLPQAPEFSLSNYQNLTREETIAEAYKQTTGMVASDVAIVIKTALRALGKIGALNMRSVNASVIQSVIAQTIETLLGVPSALAATETQLNHGDDEDKEKPQIDDTNAYFDALIDWLKKHHGMLRIAGANYDIEVILGILSEIMSFMPRNCPGGQCALAGELAAIKTEPFMVGDKTVSFARGDVTKIVAHNEDLLGSLLIRGKRTRVAGAIFDIHAQESGLTAMDMISSAFRSARENFVNKYTKLIGALGGLFALSAMPKPIKQSPLVPELKNRYSSPIKDKRAHAPEHGVDIGPPPPVTV